MIELAETQHATDFSALQARYDGLSGSDLLRPMIELEFHRKIALVSSFGTEAAVLLALAAEIDPGIPVIFLDTGKLFGSVTAGDVASAIKAAGGPTLDKRAVEMPKEHIKSTGAHSVVVDLGHDTTARVAVEVVPA